MSDAFEKQLKRQAHAIGQGIQALRVLRPFASRYWPLLVKASLMAGLVIIIRLALPWFFAAALKPWLAAISPAYTLGILPATSQKEAVLIFGAIICVLLFLLGFADHAERLYFARFTIKTVRDLRAEVVRVALGRNPATRETSAGDLVARLIGDTARIKTAVKGFLVHVATNGILFLGVCVVMLWANRWVGLVIASAGMLIALITLHGAAAIYRKAVKYRFKEGQLADSIQSALEDDQENDAFEMANRTSGKEEGAITYITGRTTWAIHFIYGLAIFGGLWLATQEMTARRMTGQEILVFAMYALMMRSPLIQLARQGTRLGKIAACCERLAEVMRQAPSPQAALSLPPLHDRIQIGGVQVEDAETAGRRRLGPINLDLAAGQRIAIIGAAGSGKSTLLHLLAGLLPLQRGAILWDGVNLATVPTDALSCQVALLSQEPQWPRQSLARYFNLPDGRCSPETLEVLRLCGAQTVIDGRPAKLDSIVSAANFSFRERQILALARVLLQSASVLLLDEPFLDSSSRNQEALLGEIFQLKKNRTMVVAFRQPVALTLFDRIIQLQNGEIIYNGAPAAHPMAERGSQEKSA